MRNENEIKEMVQIAELKIAELKHSESVFDIQKRQYWNNVKMTLRWVLQNDNLSEERQQEPVEKNKNTKMKKVK